MDVTYISTRGQAPELDFRGVTLAGLAVDGGLYVPKIWPHFSPEDLAAMVGASYGEIAERVLTPFVGRTFSAVTLRRLLAESYATFDHPDVVSLRKLDKIGLLCDLSQGPTLAFKDIALQFLGRVFEAFGERRTILGATSGDTGSAAMAALAGRKNIDVFILYPAKGPSAIQRRQMTCLGAPNVHAIAVDGSFDDCQALVKAAFNDAPFRTTYHLGAVNSINWCRILAQMVYYFVIAARLGMPKDLTVVVPTGNFGNIYAGYAARRCGLPLRPLVIASNNNDVLPRFFASGQMKAETVHSTLSPSMDIQISSNFERLLFDVCEGSGEQVRGLMAALATTGAFTVTPAQLTKARAFFAAERVDDDETLHTMREVYAASGVVLDPHTAVGVAVARRLKLTGETVTLATADPAKFPDVCQKAIGVTPEHPRLKVLWHKVEQTEQLPNDLEKLKNFIVERVSL